MTLTSMETSTEQRHGSLRTKLAALAGSPNDAQRRIASFILDQYYTVSDYSITELGVAAGVSTGTISTLCKNLGLRGYSEFRFALAREVVAQQLSNGNAVEKQTGNVAQASAGARVIRTIFGANVQALEETEGALDALALERAADLIGNARIVEVVGVASSAVVATEAALKLRKLGVYAFFQPDSHAQAMGASLLDTGDVLLAVSHSGRTAEVLRSAELARKRGASVIAVVGVGASPLRGIADVILPVAAHDTAFRVEPTASSIAALAIVHALFLLLFDREPKAADSYQRTLKAVMDREQRRR